MKTRTYLAAGFLCLLILSGACHRKIGTGQITGLSDLKQISEKAFGIKPEHISREGTEGNLAGFRTQDKLVSMRTDSRTFFVQDDNYGSQKKDGIYQGDDGAIRKRLQTLLSDLKIPSGEVQQVSILQENLQTAQIDRSTHNFKMNAIEKGAKVLKAARAIDSIPVFNSGITLALTTNQSIGFLELHWPIISEQTIKEAKIMAQSVRRGWRVPEVPEAKAELVEAGITHSSAVAQVMDVKAVIRVVYAPSREEFGRKAVYYYDLNGKQIGLPREFRDSVQQQYLPPRKSIQ